MGLEIGVRIQKKTDIDIEKRYRTENWPLCQAGKITEDEYFDNYPEDKGISLSKGNPVKNFWGLKQYIIDHSLYRIGADGGFVFELDREDVEKLLTAVEMQCVPGEGTVAYEYKCGQLAETLKSALDKVDFDTEFAEIVFYS